MIISISGKKLVGKDTTADILVRNFGFKKVALADSLKQILSAGLRIKLEDFYDQSKKELPLTTWLEESVLWSSHIDRIIRELDKLYPLHDYEKFAVDNFFRNREFGSLRDLMQKFGTECCRENIDDSIWLKILKSQIANCEQNYVCCDVRFPNERNFFRSLNAKLWLIQRDNIKRLDTHVSENQLGDLWDYHVIVPNNKTILSLTRKICKLMRTFYGKDISKPTRRRKGRNNTNSSKKIK